MKGWAVLVWLGLVVAEAPLPVQAGVFSTFGAGASWDLEGKVLEAQAFAQVQAARGRQTVKARLPVHPACGPGVAALCDEVPEDTRDPITGNVVEAAAGLQTGNPGIPGFSSGGVVAVGGVEVLWRY